MNGDCATGTIIESWAFVYDGDGVRVSTAHFTGSNKAGGNRSQYEANGINIHTIVHELGHAFASRFKSGPANPYEMIEKATFNDGTAYATSVGFHPSPDPVSARGYWTPNTSPASHETFANMFLGWTYSAWSNDTYGDQRGIYMDTNMRNTWLPILKNK